MMTRLQAPLEGIVVIVVDAPGSTQTLETALSNAGAAVFVAHDDVGIRDLLERVAPHFAVIDPSGGGGTVSRSASWMFFGHESCRTIVYSSAVHVPPQAKPFWLIDKSRPVSDVVDAVLAGTRDRGWLAKGGDDVKPER